MFAQWHCLEIAQYAIHKPMPIVNTAKPAKPAKATPALDNLRVFAKRQMMPKIETIAKTQSMKKIVVFIHNPVCFKRVCLYTSGALFL